MDIVDRAAEWRRLKDTYRHMSNEELGVIADEAYQLTELAQQAIEAEIASRQLGLKLQVQPPEPTVAKDNYYAEGAERRLADESEEEDCEYRFDPEDLDLVPLTRVWSLEEARRTKGALDDCGMPSYLGDDNVEVVQDYKGSFEGGVDLKVPQALEQRAMSALNSCPPESPEESTSLRAYDWQAYAVRCRGAIRRRLSLRDAMAQRRGTPHSTRNLSGTAIHAAMSGKMMVSSSRCNPALQD